MTSLYEYLRLYGDTDSLYNAVMTVECLSCGNYTFGAYHYIADRVRKYEPAVIA